MPCPVTCMLQVGCSIYAQRKMASPPSLEELLSAVAPAVLDDPCSDDHLVKLALVLTNWKEVAYFLKLKEPEIEAVEAGVGPELVRAKSLRMLRTWRAKYGTRATYRCLCGTLWSLRKVNVIEEVIRLLLSPTNDSDNDLCTTYVNYLKFRYSTNIPMCLIQSPRPPTHMYFDLSLIERKEREKPSIDKELASLAVEGRVMEMMEKITSVQLEDIFKLDTNRRKVILIEGPPGSGKTTLSLHICQQWEAGEPFPGFHLVIFVQLRDPAILSARSIADLLPRRDDQMAEDVYSEIKARDGEGVLFILDGWDELPGDLPRESPLRQLIEYSVCSPLQRSAVVITSRPEASSELRDLASSRLQIVGFTPEKVDGYFTECLKDDPGTAKSLVEHLKEQPSLAGICRLPLNAAIIVTLFLHMAQLPSTLTGLFVALVLHCMLRHSKSRTNLKLRSLSSLDSLPAKLQESFDSLCELAFKGVLNNQILFTEVDTGILPGFATLSLLQVVESFVTVGSARTYHFLHLSIQELLAAWHISRMPSDTQSDIVHSLLTHPSFDGVFQFLGGLTCFRTAWSRDIIKQMSQGMVRNKVLSDYIAHKWKVDLLLRCLHEAQDPALYQFVADELREHELDLWLKLSPVACHSLGYLLPLVSHATVTLKPDDEQCTVMLSKGLQKGWDDCQKPRGGLTINLYPTFALHTQDSVQAITQLSSTCGVHRLRVGLSVRPPLTWQVLLKSVAEELRDNCSLTSFGVIAWSGDTEGLIGSELCATLEHNHTLETLNLVFALQPINIDVIAIARGLTTNTTLKHLQLRKVQFEEEEIESLAKMLASNVTLTTLDLSGRGISSSGAMLLAQVLTKDNTSLTTLDLTYCDITDVGADHLANMLKTNTSLESLDLRDNNITSMGVILLAEALKHNTTLKVLRLDENTLFEGLECLASALTVNTTVTIEDSSSQWRLPPPPPGLAEILMANGVLQQLLTIAIDKTEKEFGTELTLATLVAVLEEWNELS